MASLFGASFGNMLLSIALGPSTTISKAAFVDFLDDTDTKRICFDTTHQAALKEWPGSTKYPHRITLPFRKTIGPILKEDCKVDLHDSSYSGVWCGLEDHQAETVGQWIRAQGGTVFLRDLLDLSIAISNHFGEGGRVLEFYDVESRAKYSADSGSIEAVATAVSGIIQRLPFYRDADALTFVPPRPSKEFDLPTAVTNRASQLLGKPVLVAGSWTG